MRSQSNPLAKNELQNQDRHWSRHAAQYGELFVDPYDSNVETPLWEALAAVPDPATKTVADLGCGTGPLLPYLAERFDRVIALDFAPGCSNGPPPDFLPKPPPGLHFSSARCTTSTISRGS